MRGSWITGYRKKCPCYHWQNNVVLSSILWILASKARNLDVRCAVDNDHPLLINALTCLKESSSIESCSLDHDATCLWDKCLAEDWFSDHSNPFRVAHEFFLRGPCHTMLAVSRESWDQGLWNCSDWLLFLLINKYPTTEKKIQAHVNKYLCNISYSYVGSLPIFRYTKQMDDSCQGIWPKSKSFSRNYVRVRGDEKSSICNRFPFKCVVPQGLKFWERSKLI